MKLKILHSVGHLARGGVEMWLFEVVKKLDHDSFEHHILVWTDQIEIFTKQFEQAGAVIHSVPEYKNPIRLWWRLKMLHNSYGPFHILHSHGTHFSGLLMLLGKCLGVKTRIAHSHTDIIPMLQTATLWYRLYAAIGNKAIRSFATMGIGVSNDAATSMFTENWRRDPRWKIMHCGVNFAPFWQEPDRSLRHKLGIPLSFQFIVGHVGRFETQKNHIFILEVASAMASIRSDVHFLLIGDGSLRKMFLRLVKERGLSKFFTIILDCQTVPTHMISAMDAFILPSLYEGLGLVAVEAQAARLPTLLSSNVPTEAIVDPILVQRLSLQDPLVWRDRLIEGFNRDRTINKEHVARFENSDFNFCASVTSLIQLYNDSAVLSNGLNA